MSRFCSFVFSSAMGLALIQAVPIPEANAMPRAVPGSAVLDAGIRASAVVCNAYSCWNYGPLLYSPVYRPYGPVFRPYYRPYYWPAYRPYVRPYYTGPYNQPYYPPYRPYLRAYDYPPPIAYGGGSYSGHVSWCVNRYRTYNPQTNRYHAGSGVYRVCVSPYQY